MIPHNHSIVGVFLAGIAMIGGTGSAAHGQVRGAAMRPSLPIVRPLPLVNPTMMNPTMVNPNIVTPTLNPMRPVPMSTTISPSNSNLINPRVSNSSVVGPRQMLTINGTPTSPFVVNQNQMFNRINRIYPNGLGTNPYTNPAALAAMYGGSYGGGGYGYPMMGYGNYGGAYAAPLSYSTSSIPPYVVGERQDVPDPELQRRLAEQAQLERSRNNPPLSDVMSGKALNDLLADMRQHTGEIAAEDLAAGRVALPQDLLEHINVTRNGGNLGVLKNDGRLAWPAALRGQEFQDERDQLNTLARRAVGQIRSDGQVDPNIIRQMNTDVEQMQRQLRDDAPALSFDMHVEAKRFLDKLRDAITALTEPDVGAFFTGKYTLKAKNVRDLVNQMIDNGLQFAPAVPGDEFAYSTLHKRLAAYDRALIGRDRPADAKTDSRTGQEHGPSDVKR
jgi:hypothetical protein